MPTEQTQLEYYHYYRASQKRVQQWVQRTSLELEAVTTTTTTTAGKSSDLRLNDGNSGRVISEEYSAGSGTRRKRSRRRSPSSNPNPNPNPNSNSKLRVPSGSPSKKKSRKLYPSSNGSPPLAISSLLPFGLFFPLMIFALTPPSVATLFSATILLAGYFCVDYSGKESISDHCG